MRKFYSITCLLLLSALLFSCGSNQSKEEVPEGLLPEEKIVDVLASMHLSESIQNFYITQVKDGKKDTQFNVFAENQVSREAYYNSIEYYSHHPEKMKIIYEKVMEKLNRMKAQ